MTTKTKKSSHWWADPNDRHHWLNLTPEEQAAELDDNNAHKHAHAEAAIRAGGWKEQPHRGRPDHGPRTLTTSDEPSAVLGDFVPRYLLWDECQDARHELQFFDSATECGRHYRGTELQVGAGYGDPAPKGERQVQRPELVARVEAAEAAIDEEVGWLVEVLRRGADATRRCGFEKVAKKLDEMVVKVEKSKATSSATLSRLGTIETEVLPPLRRILETMEVEGREPIPDPIRNADLTKLTKLTDRDYVSGTMRDALHKADLAVRKVTPGHVREWSHADLRAAAPHAVGQLGDYLRSNLPRFGNRVETGYVRNTRPMTM